MFQYKLFDKIDYSIFNEQKLESKHNNYTNNLNNFYLTENFYIEDGEII